jgi:hypothetical protein
LTALTKILTALLVTSAACKPESARKADHAAEELAEARKRAIDEGPALATPKVAVTEAGRLAKAEQEFRNRRAVRIQVLRGEHSVISTQAVVLRTMARSFTLTDARRAEINATLTVFQDTLAETANLISGLERVDASTWVERHDAVTEAMARLDDVRDATWHALDDALRASRHAT